MLMRKLAGAGLLFAMVAVADAGDWPQFRGPAGTGVADEPSPPIEWGTDRNVRWKVSVPGVGWSSPVVSGDRVFVTTAVTENQKKPKPFDYSAMKKDFPKDGRFPKGEFGKGGFGFPKGNQKPPDAVYRWQVLCLDRDTGKVVWEKTAREGKPTIPTQASNSYASETPLTDGERVYAYFGMHGLYCYDRDGKLVWKKDLGAYPMGMGFGTGSSPALADGRLFVQCDNEEKSFLAAFDAKTGDELWRRERPVKSSWSTPFIWRTAKRTEVVACGSQRVISYDPATGKTLWELGGITGSFNASPGADAERIYFGNSGPFASGQLVAVKAGASGDLTIKQGETAGPGLAWVRPRSGPGTASPLVYDGYVYVLGRGDMSCYKADTGEPAYSKERLEGARGFTASPWGCGNKVFCLDESGTTFVIKAGPSFEQLGKNKIDEMSWATPAISGGAIFLRGLDHLFCIGR